MALWWIPPALWLLAVLWQSVQARRRGGRDGRGRVRRAARRLYGRRRFLQLGGGVIAAGVLAHSGIDEWVENKHAESVKGDASDALSNWLHEYGERWWFFYWAVPAMLDEFVASTPLTRHGRRCYESILLGLPMLWSTQRILGASRPLEGDRGARWKFLADDNAASGHTFLSAIPWLAGLRQLQRPWQRALCALALPWGGWSRLNDRKHYLGQILLGGWIAHLATAAVLEETEES